MHEDKKKKILRRKLFSASETGDAKVLKKMMQQENVDLRWTGIDNWTALHFACRKGHTKCVEILLKSLKPLNVCAVTKSGWTPLMLAADRGHKGVVKYLLKFNANIHITASSGKTAFFLARESDHTGIAKMLTEASTKRTVDNKSKPGTKKLQIQFFRAAEQGDLNLMTHLLELAQKKYDKKKSRAQKKGIVGERVKPSPNDAIDINATGIDNWTSLHYAARKGHLRVVQALICKFKFEDPNVQTKSNWTPLMLAADKGHSDVCKLLLSKGAVADMENLQGNTASKIAIARGYHNLGQLLLAREKAVS